MTKICCMNMKVCFIQVTLIDKEFFLLNRMTAQVIGKEEYEMGS